MTADPIKELGSRVHALAQEFDRRDLSSMLAERVGRRRRGAARIVVAGAQKRGKSRLLNALVGYPDLLPVAEDVATTTHIALRSGPEPVAEVRRGTERTEVAVAELGAYASLTGEHRHGVTEVEVRLPAPLLRGLVLVDTPGIDSLTLGHRHATEAALLGADALVFALSAQDQPVLRHELEFLVEASARVPEVAFVLTRTDDSPGWSDLLAENRTRLATHLDRTGVPAEQARRLREAPWFPVSARLAEVAAAEPDPTRAARRRTRSGLDELERHLRGCAVRAQRARRAEMLAAVRAGIDALETLGRDRRAAGGGDATDVGVRLAEVEEGRAALGALRRQRRHHGLDAQFLARESTARVRARIEACRRTYEQEIAVLASPRAVGKYAEGLDESLDRSFDAVWAEVVDAVADLATEVLTTYHAQMGLPAATIDAARLVMPSREGGRRLHRGAGGQGPPLNVVADGVPAAGLALTFSSVGALAVGTSLATLPVLPIAAGVLLASSVLLQRRRVVVAGRERTALTKALGDLFAAVSVDMCLAVERAVYAWRLEADQAIEESLAVQQRELDRRRAELTAADTAAREEEARGAAALLTRLRTLRARLAELETSVR